jgi:hypothetical protein
MKKWFSIANYSYVNKIMKIITKWKNEFQLQMKQVKMQYVLLRENGNLKKKIKQNWTKKTANLKNEQKKRVRKKFF